MLEGLKGRSIAEICNEYEITQATYYQWREQFLSNCSKAFDVTSDTRREAKLEKENQKLKSLVGELTVELKKNDTVF